MDTRPFMEEVVRKARTMLNIAVHQEFKAVKRQIDDLKRFTDAQ